MSPLRHSQRLLAGAVTATLVLAAPARAQVDWTDWTAPGPTTPANTIVGTLEFLGTPVVVTYTGPYAFMQASCGTNYWSTPGTYTGAGVPTAPDNCEIIALTAGGPKTITFSQPVLNPLLGLVSWNGQPNVQLSTPFEVVNTGSGFFGSGVLTPIAGGFSTSGEVHGTLRLLGTYSSITLDDDTEFWHGFTVGATALAPTRVPEPGTVTLLAVGLLALGTAARRRHG